MRTLDRNKIKLWVVEPNVKTPKLDSDGFETGEYTSTYSTPRVVWMALQPIGGAIAEQIFGKDVSLDMISTSNEVVLTKDSFLFLSEPTSNFATTYDYRVSAINTSLNTNAYALKRRT